MKTRIALPLLSLFLVFTLSSCFEVWEKIHVRADGSGTVTLITDMSKMKELMGSMGNLGKEENENDGNTEAEKESDEPTETNNVSGMLQETANNLKSQYEGKEGISNLKVETDEEKSTVTVTFEFKDVKSLNNAMRNNNTEGSMAQAKEYYEFAADPDKFEFYKMSGGSFLRSYMPVKIKKQEGEEKMGMEMAMMMFDDAKYHLEYSFEKKVAKVKYDKSREVEIDDHALKTTYSVKEMLEQNEKLNLKVKLK